MKKRKKYILIFILLLITSTALYFVVDKYKSSLLKNNISQNLMLQDIGRISIQSIAEEITETIPSSDKQKEIETTEEIKKDNLEQPKIPEKEQKNIKNNGQNNNHSDLEIKKNTSNQQQNNVPEENKLEESKQQIEIKKTEEKTTLEKAIELHTQAGDKVSYNDNGKLMNVQECDDLGKSLYQNQENSQVYRYECNFTTYQGITIVGLRLHFKYNNADRIEYYNDYKRIMNK